MFSRALRKLLGYRLVNELQYAKISSFEVARASFFVDKAGLADKIEDLEQQCKALTDDLIRYRHNELDLIDPFMADPSPVDTEQRKLYVAAVAGLHKDILEPKLKHMIACVHGMLGEASNDRDYDQSLKGVVYALREMIRWGNVMTNEHMAILMGDSPSKPDTIIT